MDRTLMHLTTRLDSGMLPRYFSPGSVRQTLDKLSQAGYPAQSLYESIRERTLKEYPDAQLPPFEELMQQPAQPPEPPIPQSSDSSMPSESLSAASASPNQQP